MFWELMILWPENPKSHNCSDYHEHFYKTQNPQLFEQTEILEGIFLNTLFKKIKCMRKQQFGPRFGRTGFGSHKNEKRVGRSSAEKGLSDKLVARILSLVHEWRLSGEKWPDAYVSAKETQHCPLRTK
jgi:hypothetical protein